MQRWRPKTHISFSTWGSNHNFTRCGTVSILRENRFILLGSGNKIINNRISTLEIKLNQIEKTVDFLYENFEKSIIPKLTEEHTSELMALQNQDCIPIICNKKNNMCLHILVKINFPKINNFDQTEVILQALVDTSCSFTSICKSVVPQHNCFRSNIITKTRTMSGDIITNDT